MTAPSSPELERALSLLRAGEAIGLPTETVYGLAADALRSEATARIFAIKGRPTNHPLILHLADASWLDDYVADVPESARLLARAFWPGPLTLLLKRGERVPTTATGGLDTVAVRVPNHPVALEVLRAFGRPLAAPSANRFGSVSPTTREHVLADLGSDVPLVLDGGPCEVGLESTIVDLTRESPRLVRPGGISALELERVLGQAVLPADGTERAPGTLPSHYAPRARVVLVAPNELWSAVRATSARVGVLCQERPPSGLAPHVEVLELGPESGALAHDLYASLRTLDERGVELIFTTLPPPDGIGAAIADRLARAAAPRPEA